MLWQKESNKANALYADLFALSGGEARLKLMTRNLRAQTKPGQKPIKNDSISLQKRKEGNEHFGQSRWVDALELYNESICHAQPGSKNISLAYANRAACFLKMKRLDECLRDIELAKEAGYPAELMPKLDQRKIDCLKEIKEGRSRSEHFRTKLDFEPNEKFPCMANVVDIERDADGDYSVVAKADIDIGQTIVVEKVFLVYLFELKAQKCNICLKGYTNLIPCEKCAIAMFCSDKCRHNPLHDYECGLVYSTNSQLNGSLMNDVRGILLAINMFSTADELEEFVEETIKSNPTCLPDSLSNQKSQYEAFLKLPINESMISPDQMMCLTYEVYNQLLNMPKVDAFFRTKKLRRFLMHLVFYHIQILENNSVQGSVKLLSGMNQGRLVTCYNPTGLIEKYFRHSCAPNVVTAEGDGNHIFMTIRPIKKGDRLTFSCFMFLVESKDKRQKILWERRKMICSCTRCKGVAATSEERRQFLFDPDFQSIVLTKLPLDHSNTEQIQKVTDKCVNFLKKYDRTEWCDEIGAVVHIYIHLLLSNKPLTLPLSA
ncbi:uncharacterized protein LOC129568532 [Sitodiplosis mosellana]|uniref:uncharacterized protein LOC129568532 n=1 Tax=Sitodiplosis mosellana TaxID=263140 RepID=UPI0024450933|nr:uncharacterized protein LOC129568532 [Sitodiplosis mosellana]